MSTTTFDHPSGAEWNYNFWTTAYSELLHETLRKDKKPGACLKMDQAIGSKDNPQTPAQLNDIAGGAA